MKGLRHQPNYKTFHLQFVLPARCAEVMVNILPLPWIYIYSHTSGTMTSFPHQFLKNPGCAVVVFPIIPFPFCSIRSYHRNRRRQRLMLSFFFNFLITWMLVQIWNNKLCSVHTIQFPQCPVCDPGLPIDEVQYKRIIYLNPEGFLLLLFWFVPFFFLFETQWLSRGTCVDKNTVSQCHKVEQAH